MNEQIKRAVDSSIGKEVLINGDEYTIFQQKINKKNSIVFRKYLSQIILTSGAVLIIFFAVLHSNFFEETNTTENVQYPFTEEMVQDKVDYIIQNLKVGDTKEKVERLFGKGTEVETSETSTEITYIWNYNFFKKPGTIHTYDHLQVDMERIKNNELGVELNIIWNNEIVDYAFFVYKDSKGNTKTYYLNRDGTTTVY